MFHKQKANQRLHLSAAKNAAPGEAKRYTGNSHKMKITFTKFCFLLSIISLLNVCGNSGIYKAIPGEVYSHKTGEIKLHLETKELFTVYATYDWSICNKDAFKKEMKYFYMRTLKPRIENRLIDTMKLVAAYIQDANIFFSDTTRIEIQIELSNILKPKGLCAEKLKIYPYNKSLNQNGAKDAPPVLSNIGMVVADEKKKEICAPYKNMPFSEAKILFDEKSLEASSLGEQLIESQKNGIPGINPESVAVAVPIGKIFIEMYSICKCNLELFRTKDCKEFVDQMNKSFKAKKN